jgi:hypothetical protein
LDITRMGERRVGDAQSLERVTGPEACTLAAMDVELDPEQPPEIARAVRALLLQGGVAPDPWWQAGLEEALDSSSDET